MIKYIALNKRLLQKLAQVIQSGRVTNIAPTVSTYQFAVTLKGPTGNLAKKHPESITLLPQTNEYKIYLTTYALDDESVVVAQALGLNYDRTIINRKANKLIELYQDLKQTQSIGKFISQARQEKVEDWIMIALIHSFINKRK